MNTKTGKRKKKEIFNVHLVIKRKEIGINFQMLEKQISQTSKKKSRVRLLIAVMGFFNFKIDT